MNGNARVPVSEARPILEDIFFLTLRLWAVVSPELFLNAVARFDPYNSTSCRTVTPSRTPVSTLRRIAPVFVTTDLARSLAHYERLGFTVESYDNADYYGFACRDGIEIHLCKVDQVDRRATTSCAYLWVDDAAARYAAWTAAGVEG